MSNSAPSFLKGQYLDFICSLRQILRMRQQLENKIDGSMSFYWVLQNQNHVMHICLDKQFREFVECGSRNDEACHRVSMAHWKSVSYRTRSRVWHSIFRVDLEYLSHARGKTNNIFLYFPSELKDRSLGKFYPYNKFYISCITFYSYNKRYHQGPTVNHVT